ncbi:hypothetical protein [Nitrosopumilus oxyclinae]|nr:hypothetical protein [Nitrosopumilus oxyclinae]
MTKLLYASILTAVFAMSVLTPNAFAQSDFNRIDGDEIKNSSISQDILAKIEFSKQQFLKAKEVEKTRNAHQKFIDEQRIIAEKSLEEEIQRMNQSYKAFTPKNAFASYVSKLNATDHGIFWDQFDYLQAKITLAKDARDSVLKQGGTFSEAMKQYVKYAKMPKVEMQNIVRDLNVKHNLADAKIQSYFDINGKLPRYDNDLESPCYGCNEKISKLQISSEQSVPIKRVVLEQKPTKINDLRESLSELQSDFLKSRDVIAQKKMVFEMNNIIKNIQELK